MKRLLAIGVIWLGCALAWVVLGSTVVVRSGESSFALTREVHELWGPPGRQSPPRAIYREPRTVKETITNHDAQGRPFQSVVEREVVKEFVVPLDASDIDVDLALEHRRKGLMWFPTYEVGFQADYTFVNPTQVPRTVEMVFPIAVDNAGYDGFTVRGPDGKPGEYTIRTGSAVWIGRFAPGERRAYQVAYKTRGTSTWHYDLTEGTGQVKDFHLDMSADAERIDFPAGTLSASKHGKTPSGWSGAWDFTSLIASNPIGIELPKRLNPGPLASRITFFAPVGLLFFFFVVAVFATAQSRNIHPLNYFFFGCAFFAFHLLFAYLVDHLAILASFAIASGVSIFLVVSYARLFVGWGFALREMALAQLIYLVLFSYTFFWSGFTGLAITIGAILTLFVMMQFTGRVDWNALASPAPKPAKP